MLRRLLGVSGPSQVLARVAGLLGRLPGAVGRRVLRLGPAGAGRALGPLSFWFCGEWIYVRWCGLQPARPGALLKYRTGHYHGPPLTLADGTTVRSGDRIVEMHLDNAGIAAKLAASKADRRTAWTWLVLKELTEDLRALAAPGTLEPEVRALHGVTLLAHASRRLGFEVRARPRSVRNDITRFYMLGLLTIYSPDGRRRLASAERDAYLGEIWLGRRALTQRYGQPADGVQV